MKVTAVIIDDESHARKMLKMLLMDSEIEVEVLAEGESAEEGITILNDCDPDVLFLDIDMPGLSGMQLAEMFGENRDFEIIFITGHQEQASKAFRVKALDFLMKPVSPRELDDALNRLLATLQDRDKPVELSNSRIALPMSDGLELVNIADIISFEAERAYTTIRLKDGSSKLVSKRLKLFEDLLSDNVCFKRVHRSGMVNLDHLVKYSKADAMLIMVNDIHVPVSKEHKPWVDEYINALRP
jgi:two-component system, LytTR family, response regulator